MAHLPPLEARKHIEWMTRSARRHTYTAGLYTAYCVYSIVTPVTHCWSVHCILCLLHCHACHTLLVCTLHTVYIPLPRQVYLNLCHACLSHTASLYTTKCVYSTVTPVTHRWSVHKSVHNTRCVLHCHDRSTSTYVTPVTHQLLVCTQPTLCTPLS